MTKNSLRIAYASVNELRGNPRSARRHSKDKIGALVESIRTLGFNVPLIIDADNLVLAGHARLAAAKALGMDEVPVVRVSHLDEVQARAFMLADNKFAVNATWDFEVLAGELQELIDVGFDAVLTGFSVTEIDLTLEAASNASTSPRPSKADQIPKAPETVVSERRDLWALGNHRLLCGDARDPESYERLLGDEKADIVFTDPPYNVRIPGHVSGLGSRQHGNFAMACGEMTEQQFIGFLALTLCLIAKSCRDGAIAYVAMDWRHAGELLDAGKVAFSELKNICVWNKLRGGMGALWRSQHELIFAFKVGAAPHTNNVQLGSTGRHRTNVWDYHGVNALTPDGAEALEMHPTVKPVAMIEDALKDCSRRGEIVLDAFGGSGSTLIAAQKCGRRARLIEFEPRYCDTIIERYQRYTGKAAILAATGKTFEDVAEVRRALREGDQA